jgi:GDP-L-fucose synthase
MIKFSSKIYVAGHNGMVGSACVRLLKKSGYKNIIVKSSSELDLRNQFDVNEFISIEKPVAVINAAAKVGGIVANSSFPYEFIMENMLIQNNLIDSCFKNNIDKFIYLGSSCIYPKYSKQPIKEEYLLTGELEKTNQWYAIAKISGLKAVEALRNQYNKDYFSLMPTNLFGINDNYSKNNSHVIPGLIRRFHEAKINQSDFVEVWGTGKPLREFLFVDDLAHACKLILEANTLSKEWPFDKNLSFFNVGSGYEISILELAEKIKKTVGFNGKIIFDKSKPDGTPRKLIDSSKINKIGWNSVYTFDEALKITYASFIKNHI